MDERAAQRILELAAAIPPGLVATYGDLSPRAPRLAGAVLRERGAGVRWHRVVRADGTLALGARQRRALEAEGVGFLGSRVDLASHRIPREALEAEAEA